MASGGFHAIEPHLRTKCVSDVNATDVVGDEVVAKAVGNAELHGDSVAVEHWLCILQVALGDAKGRQELGEHDLLELGDYDVLYKLKFVVIRALPQLPVILHNIAEAVVLAQSDYVLGGEEGVLGDADVAGEKQELLVAVGLGGKRQEAAFGLAQAARSGLTQGLLQVRGV